MTTLRTVYESLSFDTEVRDHATLVDAREYMFTVLTRYGDWPVAEARAAALKGTSVLVRDNGDDETIRIEEAR